MVMRMPEELVIEIKTRMNWRSYAILALQVLGLGAVFGLGFAAIQRLAM